MYKEQESQSRHTYRSYYPSLKSMVLLASNHALNPKLLVDAFFEAWKNKISYCGSLKISCRKVNHDSATFLITEEEKVVGQFPINLEIIRDQYVRDSIKKIPLPDKVKKIDNLGKNLKISELRFGMKGINLLAKIIEIPPTRHVFTMWGSEANVTSVKMVDETGSVRLGLWNDQIRMVNIGNEVEIKNCNVTSFASELQLKLGRKSTMSVINQLQEELIKYPIAK